MIRKYSIWIMIVSIFALIAWDVFAFNAEENSTFSVIIADLYYNNPIYSIVICVLVGALLGHWFAPAKGSKD